MEAQAIREVKRIERAEPTVFDRLRGRRRVDPLRETADGLGVVLDKLSESVTDVMPRRRGSDYVDDGYDEGDIEAGRRTRGFKLHRSQEDVPPSSMTSALEAEAEGVAADATDTAGAAESDEAAAARAAIAEEVDEVINILKQARNVAADAIAPQVVVPAHDRAAAKEKLKELFVELGMKRIEIISSIFSGGPEEINGVADLFSLSTPENAKMAYNGIDAMIMRFLNAGRDVETTGVAGGAGSVYEGHEAAISATEQLKEYLQRESPEKAFTRFREVNRSNILGLLE